MNTPDKHCTLHQQLYSYYCQQCEEPICQQCTILGPHHTPLHLISPIAIAYQHKVNQVKERIAAVLTKKEVVESSIGAINLEMQEIKSIASLSIDENSQHKARMLKEIERSHQKMMNELNLLKQELEEKMNQLNDLGHNFETLDNDIEVLASHSNILQGIKDCMDHLELLLSKQHSLPQLPKQLSDLRWDLKSIQVYKGLICQKQKLLHQLLLRLDTERAKLAKPVIDYQSLLSELSLNIEESTRHSVCHYCGVVFTVATANRPCPKNNSTLSIGEFEGYCSVKPESSKWATQRHFFAPPAQPLKYYSTTEQNSFGLELRALLLKLKTIVVVKKMPLMKKFEEADKRKSGGLNKIEMMYVLRELCGLMEGESEIVLSQCRQPEKNTFTYRDLVEQLNLIDI